MKKPKPLSAAESLKNEYLFCGAKLRQKGVRKKRNNIKDVKRREKVESSLTPALPDPEASLEATREGGRITAGRAAWQLGFRLATGLTAGAAAPPVSSPSPLGEGRGGAAGRWDWPLKKAGAERRPFWRYGGGDYLPESFSLRAARASRSPRVAFSIAGAATGASASALRG